MKYKVVYSPIEDLPNDSWVMYQFDMSRVDAEKLTSRLRRGYPSHVFRVVKV